MKFNPYLETLLAATIWGSTGLFIKTLQLPSTTLTFIRAVVPALIIGVYLFSKRKKLFRKGILPMIWASVLNGIRMLLYFIGFNLTTVGNAVIILYTGPVFVTLFSSLYLKEKITYKKVLLLLLAFAGILVMYSNSYFSFTNKDFIGMTAVLFSTIIFAFTVIIFKKEIDKYSRLETVFYQNLIPVFMFLPFLFINQPFPTLFQWTLGSIYAFLIGVVGFTLYFSALKRIDASTSSILTYVEVVSAITLAVVFLHETITWNMVIGGAMILTSTILLNLYSKKI